MEKFDIREWVDRNPDQLPFRQAVHTILTAISDTPRLQATMIMKGGILLALGYDSSRFTKDIDFSTSITLAEFDQEAFIKVLEASLIAAGEALGYGLDCRIQAYRQQPSRHDATFPTIQIRVGYAYKNNRPAHRRLMVKQATHVVQVDYSLNEPPGVSELFELDESRRIRTYSFHDLIAEKFRALLQQESRNRFRRQDVYDLYFVLQDHPFRDNPVKQAEILRSLREKAAARNLSIDRESMGNPQIKRRSRRDYETLASEIEEGLPDFEEVYAQVQALYKSLPWES